MKDKEENTIYFALEIRIQETKKEYRESIEVLKDDFKRYNEKLDTLDPSLIKVVNSYLERYGKKLSPFKSKNELFEEILYILNSLYDEKEKELKTLFSYKEYEYRKTAFSKLKQLYKKREKELLMGIENQLARL